LVSQNSIYALIEDNNNRYWLAGLDNGLLVTAAAGTSDQTFSNQILTVTNAGVPVWSTALDGGTF
jgi:hypothetical protein